MATINQTQILKSEIETNYPILNDKIKDGIDEFNNYLEVFKEEKYEERLNETEDDAIKRAESIYDRLDEMIKRNELSNKKALDIIELLKKMIDLFNGIVNNTENEKEFSVNKNNGLIDKIIELEQQKTSTLIIKNPRRLNELIGTLEDKKVDWNEHRIKTKKMKQKEEMKKRIDTVINDNEIQQIETWTSMKIGNIIFDSNVDNWNINTSVFDQRVINKRNLIVLIEEQNGNKFGGYVNANVSKQNTWINDPKSFLFLFRSNEKSTGMKKVGITEPQYAFYLFNKSENCLFGIGRENFCRIFKENNKNQSTFNYLAIENGLRSVTRRPQPFSLKRITVIQLI